MNIDLSYSILMDYLADYLPNVILAIVVLLVGLRLISKFTNLVEMGLKRKGIDETLVPFLKNLTSWGLKVLLFISVASMVGIATTSFVAVLGAASLAVGLALQGSLSHFAGGVLLLVFRPFRIGDFIEAQGFSGTVEQIDVFSTLLKTLQNQRVVLPNGPLASGPIKNYSTHPLRRVDLPIGIGYDDDVKKAMTVLKEMCSKHPLVLQEPEEPFVGVTDYGDSSINLVTRSWVKSEDYWSVYFSLNQSIKEVLDANEISIPYPQRDLNVVGPFKKTLGNLID